jgi:hypothetical protein
MQMQTGVKIVALLVEALERGTRPLWRVKKHTRDLLQSRPLCH